MKKVIRKVGAYRLEIVAFVVGASILTYELTASRIVAPYLGTTIYTWTSIIGVILAALAVGYIIGGKIADNRRSRADVALLLTIASAMIMASSLYKDSALDTISKLHTPEQLTALFASMLLFAPATLLMGATAPYLARLSIRDVASSGHRVSRIDAASTLGSLAGTFSTGYFLFAFIGTERLLLLVALALLLVSALMHHKEWLYVRLGIATVLLVLWLLPSQLAFAGVVADIDTAYNRIFIRDTPNQKGTIRLLQFDGEALQSGAYADGRAESPFLYTRLFNNLAYLAPRDNGNYLVVGGGSLNVPQQLALAHPGAQVDVAEIDGRIEQIAKDYFGYKPQSNLHFIASDGRMVLKKYSNRYDIIYLDAFSSKIPPFHLLTRQSFQEAHQALTDDGIVIANIIDSPAPGTHRLADSIYRTTREEFSFVSVFRMYVPGDSYTKQNLMLIASKNPLPRSRLDLLMARYPEVATLLDNPLDMDRSDGLLLTDNYAPVEHLTVF